MPDWRAYVRDRLPPLAAPPERASEVIDEIAQHLQGIYDGALRNGASPAEAQARVDAEIPDWRALWNDLQRAEAPLLAAPRSVAIRRVEPMMHRSSPTRRLLEILADVRFSARALRSKPLFTLTTVLTFALGIGATGVVFALVHSVLLSPLPYRDPGQLVVVQQVIPEIAERIPILGVNPRSYTAWEQSCRASCAGLATIGPTTATLTGLGEPEGLAGARISSSFFDVLGTPPAIGRAFTREEDAPGGNRVVIVSHAFWQHRLAGDPTVLGRVLTLDGVPVEIVGVLPATFRVPPLPQLSAPYRAGESIEFFRPMAWSDEYRRALGEFDNVVIVRRPDGVSVEATEAELTALTRAAFEQAPIHPYAVVRPLIEGVTASARRPLWLLLGAVAAALLIACVNVAGLLGARWTARQHELAIRTAIGASRWRQVQLVATEALLLSGAGGVLGCALAAASLRTILAAAPAAVPRLEDVRLDTTTLAVLCAVTLACAILCALVPAWRASHVDPNDTLKAGSLTTTPGRWNTIRAWLVGAEVALTTVLLVVGGLLALSFVNVLRIDRGFTTAGVVAANIELPASRYPDAAARAKFFDALLDSLEQAPGIQAAGLSRMLPLEGDATVDAFVAEGDTRTIAEQPVGNHIQVSAGYFQVLGLPLVRGRLFTRDDHARPVAIISERTARAVWLDRDAIGRTFRRGSQRWQVVGIVADSKIRGFEQDPGLVAYVPYGLYTRNGLTLAIRTTGHHATTIASARRAVKALDPDLPLRRVRTLDTVVDDALAMRRFQVRLMMGFAGAGLLLACLGLYGVLSGTVEGRRGELAIRLALGASPAGLRRLIIRQGLRPVIAGLALGLAGGAAAARLTASLLFGVSPAQPAVIVCVIALVLAVSIAACLGPAARAGRTSFVSALRGS